MRVIEIEWKGRRIPVVYRDEGRSVFASDIPLIPGEWPDTLEVWSSSWDDPPTEPRLWREEWTRGTFNYARVVGDERPDLESVHYWSPSGNEAIEVWND